MSLVSEADTPYPAPAHSPPDFPSDFPGRYARWQLLHRTRGPGRSYPHAWRLPELAKPLGSAALVLAQTALALDLYTLGRFPESRAALPRNDAPPQARLLARRLTLLLDAPCPGADPFPSLDGAAEQAYLNYLVNQPMARIEAVPEGDSPEHDWLHLLTLWAQPPDPRLMSRAHASVAMLAQRHPCLAAQGEAVLAEMAFKLAPAWSLVWLDHALEQTERYSQHHLKARLLGLKARALAAAGALGESERFRRQAVDLAERQGARLYLERWLEITPR